MNLDLAFVKIALTKAIAISATVVLGIRIKTDMMKTNTWKSNEPRFSFCGNCANQGHCHECYRGSMLMSNTCANCSNAYNQPDDSCPHCWNKEFEAQFRTIDVRVQPNETCGTWSLRRKDQAPLVWNKEFQLSLLDELLNS